MYSFFYYRYQFTFRDILSENSELLAEVRIRVSFLSKIIQKKGNKFLKRSKLTFFIPIHRIPNRYFIFVQNNKTRITRKKISRDIDSSNHCILVFRRSIFQKKLRASIIQSPIHLPIKLFKKQKKHRTSNQKLNNPNSFLTCSNYQFHSHNDNSNYPLILRCVGAKSN